MKLEFGSFTFSISALFIIGLVIIYFIWRKFRAQKLAAKSSVVTKKNTIAVVRVNGIILNNIESSPPLSRIHATYGDTVKERLETLAKNDKIIGCVVYFATNGGLVPGSISIAEGIEAFKKSKKPIFSFIDGISASGGVMGMVPADAIFAREGSLTGSIGIAGPTIQQFKDVTSLGDGLLGSRVDAKIDFYPLHAGEGKLFGSPFNYDNDKGRENFQEILDRSYESFLNHVAKYRNISVDSIRNAGAHIMDTTQALDVGLIDGVCTENVVLADLAKRCDLSIDDCVFKEFDQKVKPSFFDIFSSCTGYFPFVSPYKGCEDTRTYLQSQPLVAISQDLQR